MPAPAVIPAPRAYINAVAVKGFVVELGAAKETTNSHYHSLVCARPPLLHAREQRNKDHGNAIYCHPSIPLRMRCMYGRTSVIFTVTKKARPKQSFDMNFKAWDNKAAAYGLPFRLLLVLNVCGRLWIRTTGVAGECSLVDLLPALPGLAVCSFGCGTVSRLAVSRNEGGLFGGERT